MNAIAKKPTALEPGYDGHPPDIQPTDGISKEEIAARAVLMRNHGHCAICRLVKADHITKIQHMAGEELQDDSKVAEISGYGHVNLESLGITKSFGQMTPSEAKCHARQRKSAALMALGTSGRFLVEKIVLEDWTFAQIAPLMRVNEKGVLPALRVALDQLALHYGFVVHAR